MAGIDLNDPATYQHLNAAETQNLQSAVNGLNAASNYSTAFRQRSKSSKKGHELTMEIHTLTQKLGILEAARVKARGKFAAANAVMGQSLGTLTAHDKIIALTVGDIPHIIAVVAAGFKGTVYANTVDIQTLLAAEEISSELSLEED